MKQTFKAMFERLEGLLPWRKPAPSLRQRRRHIRIETAPRNVHFTVESERVEAEIRDVSVSGMRVALERRVECGALLTVFANGVTSSETPSVHARVMWCRKRDRHVECGLMLVDTPDNLSRSWVKRLLLSSGLRPEACTEQRRHTRVRAGLAGRVKTNTRESNVWIADLSRGGALLNSSSCPRPGLTVTVLLPRNGLCPAVSLEGQVVRTQRTMDGRAWQVSVRFRLDDEAGTRQLTSHLMHLIKRFR